MSPSRSVKERGLGLSLDILGLIVLDLYTKRKERKKKVGIKRLALLYKSDNHNFNIFLYLYI